MKKYVSILVSLTLLIMPARTQVEITLDAGALTGPGGVTSSTNAMQVDNTSPSTNGSLLLVVDIGSSIGAAIDTAITPGNFVAGTNTILAAGGFNNNGGTDETITNFNITTGVTGSYLALLWFPQITYNQYQTGTVTLAGDYFGAYMPSPLGSVPADGGPAWELPSPGNNVEFFFTTSNTDFGGNEPASAGQANYQIEAEDTDTPTMPPWALMLLALLLFSVASWLLPRKTVAINTSAGRT